MIFSFIFGILLHKTYIVLLFFLINSQYILFGALGYIWFAIFHFNPGIYYVHGYITQCTPQYIVIDQHLFLKTQPNLKLPVGYYLSGKAYLYGKYGKLLYEKHFLKPNTIINIRNIILKACKHSKYSEFLETVILGDRSNLNRNLFKKAGLYHIVTCLHMFLIMQTLKYLLRLFPFISIYKRRILVIIISFLYIILNFFPLHTIRAWIFYSLLMLNSTFNRKLIFQLMALIFLLFDVNLIFDKGFQLSFGFSFIFLINESSFLLTPLIGTINPLLFTYINPFWIVILFILFCIFKFNFIIIIIDTIIYCIYFIAKYIPCLTIYMSYEFMFIYAIAFYYSYINNNYIFLYSIVYAITFMAFINKIFIFY